MTLSEYHDYCNSLIGKTFAVREYNALIRILKFNPNDSGTPDLDIAILAHNKSHHSEDILERAHGQAISQEIAEKILVEVTPENVKFMRELYF